MTILMQSYFVDIVLDIDWYSARAGTTVLPRATSTGTIDGWDRAAQLLLYGDGTGIKHLRVVFLAADDEEMHAITDKNIAFWRDAIAVTSAMATSEFSGIQTLEKNSALHAVFCGRGDGETPFLGLTRHMSVPPAADYEGAVQLMARWNPNFRHHLHFLAKFLNDKLPADIRWLQGYRFLEWHFERGGTKLSKNQNFQDFLAKFGGGLDAHMPKGRSRQTRAGFLEEVRALVAHAVMGDRPNREDQEKIEHAVTNTFSVIERLTIQILNEDGPQGVSFMPKIGE